MAAQATTGLPPWQLARRQRIVEAALRALETRDYEEIQIRDVARSAGVALGTLYRYFSSKEHLYAAVLQEWAAFDRPRRAAGLPPREKARQRVRAIIRAFERQPQFYRVHVLLQTSTDSNARTLLAEFAASAQASLAHEFEALGPAEAEDAAVMLWSIISTLVTRAIYRGSTVREAYRVADRFLDLLEPRWPSMDMAQTRI